MIHEIRTELRFAWRSFVIPAAIILCALIAVSNVVNAAMLVGGNYAQVHRVRGEYRETQMNWQAALAKPNHVVQRGGFRSTDNPARDSYEQLTVSINALSPASSVSETLKYIGFIVYPALFFLIGVWLVTGQRRYRLDKVGLVRAGPILSIASKQVALALIAAICVAATLIVDVVIRSIAFAQVAGQIPFTKFPLLAPLPTYNSWSQWGVALLTIAFFGSAGIAIGALAQVFAIPAVLFLGYNFVFPILAVGDPRNWFEVLGHAVFEYSGVFELADPIPIAVPIALSATLASTIALIALGYVGIRIRNPRAT